MTLIVLSLGSNIDRERNIRYAVERIRARFGETRLSPVYETSSVGFDGPAFFNLVAGIESDDSVETVRDALREIEVAAGRVRGPKTYGDRVLDIDILLYGEADLSGEGYNIPRDEIERHAFVLKPLADLYPSFPHPVSKVSFDDLWRDFDATDQELALVPMTW